VYIMVSFSGVYNKMQKAELGTGTGSMTDNLEDTLNGTFGICIFFH